MTVKGLRGVRACFDRLSTNVDTPGCFGRLSANVSTQGYFDRFSTSGTHACFRTFSTSVTSEVARTGG